MTPERQILSTKNSKHLFKENDLLGISLHFLCKLEEESWLEKSNQKSKWYNNKYRLRILELTFMSYRVYKKKATLNIHECALCFPIHAKHVQPLEFERAHNRILAARLSK